jgi:DNA-binding transcriptional LysR family regulator
MHEFSDTPRISMRTRHVAAIPFIVAAGDCTAIVPREVSSLFAEAAGIRAVKLPIAIPPIQVYPYWHPCMSSDPAVTFFRELVFETSWD